MKRTLFACLGAALVTATAFAGPAETGIVAAMKLPDAPNYGWTSEVVDDARTYTITGKTDRATDLSRVDMPLVSEVRRRVGRSGGNSDNASTLIFQGDTTSVIETDDGWKKPDEISSNNSNSRGGYGGGGGMGGFGGRRGRRGGFGGNGSGDGSDSSKAPPYSNLQKTLSRPHEEVAIIVAGYTDMKAEGEIISGTLTEDAAKLLLVHPGQEDKIEAKKASGTFRLWIRDGVLVKYETVLEGTLTVDTNSGKHDVTVHQKTTTMLNGVGTTTFDVPDDAKKKLAS